MRMFALLLVTLVSTMAFAQAAPAGGVFAEVDEIFAKRSLCDGSSSDQESAEHIFKIMYLTLKMASARHSPSMVEVLDHNELSTTLKHTGHRAVCTLALPAVESPCYTVSCHNY